ncbi:MAG: DeoR/GlpR family DNA-binding transcription regulator [Erysipelotrichaceae bacterium]|nr:DeoR/GlpR family DNA-binding transcription regulator [Erysipelotrichaceae bacterium]
MKKQHLDTHDRRIMIYDKLIKNELIKINDLAKEFNVSSMTIRRDLSIFEKQDLITTTYGGAYLNHGKSIEADFSLKTSQMVGAKLKIAKYAASLITENDTIIIDCGSTALQLAKQLPNIKMTVVTNSWPIINYLGNNKKIKLILACGTYNSISGGTLDSKTISFFNTINADKVFMSSQALDFERGLTVPDPIDAEVKKSMFNAGRLRYLMIDHSKIDHTYLAKHADVVDFDLVIVDDQLSDKAHQQFKTMNAKLKVV